MLAATCLSGIVSCTMAIASVYSNSFRENYNGTLLSCFIVVVFTASQIAVQVRRVKSYLEKLGEIMPDEFIEKVFAQIEISTVASTQGTSLVPMTVDGPNGPIRGLFPRTEVVRKSTEPISR